MQRLEYLSCHQPTWVAMVPHLVRLQGLQREQLACLSSSLLLHLHETLPLGESLKLKQV